jgi:hypothetical protein
MRHVNVFVECVLIRYHFFGIFSSDSYSNFHELKLQKKTSDSKTHKLLNFFSLENRVSSMNLIFCGSNFASKIIEHAN